MGRMPQFSEVRFSVCKLCHRVCSLEEEKNKKEYGDGYAHEECIRLAVKRSEVRKTLG